MKKFMTYKQIEFRSRSLNSKDRTLKLATDREICVTEEQISSDNFNLFQTGVYHDVH
jgi:hypothetical protein